MNIHNILRTSVILLSVNFFVLPIAAQYLMPPHWREDIHRATQQALANQPLMQSRHVINSAVTLTIPISKQYYLETQISSKENPSNFADSAAYRLLQVSTFSGVVGCKAYALDDNWLIAGGTCLWNARQTIHKDGQVYQTGLIQPDQSKIFVEIQGHPVPMTNALAVQPSFTKPPHLILLHVPSQSQLAPLVRQLPKIHVLAFSQRNPSQLTGGQFFINSSRFGMDITQSVLINSFHRDTYHQKVTLKNTGGVYKGLSTDPLFFAKDGQAYLVGINDGIMEPYVTGHRQIKKWDGHPSTDYFLFSWSDLKYIQQVIAQKDPAAWQRILPRLHLERIGGDPLLAN